MKHACAAYFPKSFDVLGQTIEEHIIKGIEFIEKVYLERRLDDYLVRLARFLGFEVSGQESRNAIYASYIFHDLGKLSKDYQERRYNFGGHEIISAYWVIQHGSQLALKEMLYPVVLSIYLHHHDIRRSNLRNTVKANLCNECVKTLLGIYREKTFIDLTTYNTKLEGEFHFNLKDQLMIYYYRLSYPLLQVVHSADNYSASERGGKCSILSTEIRNFFTAIGSLRENFGRSVRLQ